MEHSLVRSIRVLLNTAKSFLYFCLDSFIIIGRAGNTNSDLVCVVRLDNIGDFVLWLDSARQIRNHYAHSKIVLIANSTFSALAESLPYWDDVISVDVRSFTRNYLYRWKLMRTIRRLGANTVIQPTVARMFLTGDSVVRISGAHNRIGSVGDLSNISDGQQRISNKWYTDIYLAEKGVVTELERNVAFLRDLGIESPILSVAYLPKLTDLIRDNFVVKEYFIIFPGASWAGKIWPEQRFVECADYVHAQFGWTAVLCGGHQDVGRCGLIRDGIGSHDAIDLSGQTSIVELVELIRNANLLIGNDTSAVHIAAAVKTPSVCILGGGHYGRFLPYPESAMGNKPVVAISPMSCFGCNWRCIQSFSYGNAMPCVQSVEVSTVLEAVNYALTSSVPRVPGPET